MNLNNRKLLGYILTVIPALLAFIQLFLLYKISSLEANKYFSEISLSLMLSGILSFNTGYVFIMRAVELNNEELFNEYNGIILFRIVGFLIIILPAILLFSKESSFFLIIYSFCKLLIEIKSVYLRAIDKISELFKVVIIVFVVDLCVTIYCFFIAHDFIIYYSIGSFLSLLIISNRNLFNHNINITFNKSKFKIYFSKILPLSLSSVRENLSGSGLIFIASYTLLNNDLEKLINGTKIYSVGSILIGVYSNFYVQDLLRKGRNIKDENILMFLLLFSYFILQLFLINTHLFSDVANKINIIFIFFYILGIVMQAKYFVYQNTMLRNNKNIELYIFESIYIITFLITLITKNFNYYFIINFISFSISFTIIKIKTKIYELRLSRN